MAERVHAVRCRETDWRRLFLVVINPSMFENNNKKGQIKKSNSIMQFQDSLSLMHNLLKVTWFKYKNEDKWMWCSFKCSKRKSRVTTIRLKNSMQVCPIDEWSMTSRYFLQLLHNSIILYLSVISVNYIRLSFVIFMHSFMWHFRYIFIRK